VRRSLPSWLLGSLSLALLIVNTILWCTPFYVFGIARLLVPIERWRRAMNDLLRQLAEGWIQCNGLLLGLVHEIDWDVRGIEGLRHDARYLISCNHQTWADIPILQRTFNRRIPFIRFFLKQELIWVPLLGLAWWFLDYPFMKRYSRETLEKRPELRGRDLERARKACEKFRRGPVSLLNFLEGSRFTAAKHAHQQSPYRRLLRPKAGGMAFVLDAMGGSLRSLLDVTIVYPDGAPDFWEFLAGGLDRVIVHVEERPIPQELLGGDYLGDRVFREQFQAWIEDLWKQKDEQMAKLLVEHEKPPSDPHDSRHPRP
jgi:1-acyl-sn-glycerol-3-phosphate acyltransferase